MLFVGDGVQPQRPRGLMWLTIAKNGAASPKDEWIRELYQRDFLAASDQDRQAAAALLEERAKGPPLPSAISRTLVKTLQILRPLGIPMLAGATPPAARGIDPGSLRGPAANRLRLAALHKASAD